MSELRHDKANDIWTIIAPERHRRPRVWRSRRPAAEPTSQFDPTCPFCPGNESLLPKILWELPSAEPPGWQTRVVPNKFPAVTTERLNEPCSDGIYTAAEGYGYHEVIIETPRHNGNLEQSSDADVRALIATYHRRYLKLLARPLIRSVILFRNHGADAGASLRHPHSQIIALRMKPPLMHSRELAVRRFRRETGHCAICEILDFEQQDGRRVVLETPFFLAIVPYAASAPFEIWMIPKHHQADFGEATEAEQYQLATTLRRVLLRLRSALNDPPYNYVINSASKGAAGRQYLHWYLRLVPDLVVPAGFELGAGLPINPSIPEEDAALLRSAEESSR
jgi:UDPglucose--hexose-1-phosphate uridylyltransferase